MTYYPHSSLPRRPTASVAAPGNVRPGLLRDILWNRPVFKAPVLPIPPIAPEVLPFKAARVTQRSARR